MNFKAVAEQFVGLTMLAGLMVVSGARAGDQPSPGTAPGSAYTLLYGSYLIDDCPPCAQPTILEPMRGHFDLKQLDENPLFSRYELRNISFEAGLSSGRTYKVMGHGTYTVGGEVAVLQDLFLEVYIDDGLSNRLCYLTNATRTLSRQWPFLEVELVQTNGTFTQVYHLRLLAAPMRDVWFSTAHEFTSANWNPPTNHASPGDLLSLSGKRQRRNTELTARLGILPGLPDPGLDAVTVSAQGEILFSLDRDVFSDAQGWLQQGDLLSDTGRLVRRNQDLYAAFSPMPSPAPPDVGLDAVHVLDSGEIYFSIQTEVFSERLGVTLRRGDLLSDRGLIVRTNEALLARFHPPAKRHDYGLDAVHVWANGEIWFSLEEGFQDDQLGPILPGDLLSDQGYIVFRNVDLINPFAPMENLADFGLDALAVITNAPPLAPPSPAPQVWTYTLLQDSQLTDDCPVCDRIPIVAPMRGKFDLQLVEENPLFSRYAVQNISFTATGAFGPNYKVTGHGSYRVGGEVALVQDLVLEVLIDNGATNKLCYLTNDSAAVERLWPMIQIHLDQTNGTVTQVYRFDLSVAPLREIWFSTKHDFHPAKPNAAMNPVTAGDLISSAGRVVKRNRELTAGFAFGAAMPDLGLDALDILPGAEMAFSIEQDGFSETLGVLHHGDILFARSRQIVRNEDLMLPLTGGQRPPYDLGLDALHFQPDLQIYFSVQSNLVVFNDPQPKVDIRRGDLLFTDLVRGEGRIVKRNEELLARFHPAAPVQDSGLSAIYLWPNGEIWFATESGFADQNLGQLQPGDLLSDQGYVVFRNLELLSAFAPLETRSDFGLDALFVVSDAAPSGPGSKLTRIAPAAAGGGVELQWEGSGRVFQVQRARDPAGPYLPVSEIVPDLFFNDGIVVMPQSYYRLRQW